MCELVTTCLLQDVVNMLTEREEELIRLKKEMVDIKGTANEQHTASTRTTDGTNSSTCTKTTSTRNSSPAVRSSSGDNEGTAVADRAYGEGGKLPIYRTSKGKGRLESRSTITVPGSTSSSSTAQDNCTNAATGGGRGPCSGEDGVHRAHNMSVTAAEMLRMWNTITEQLHATEVLIHDLSSDKAASTIVMTSSAGPGSGNLPGELREKSKSMRQMGARPDATGGRKVGLVAWND